MKTYQADEAIAKFRSCFDEAGLEYEIVDSDASRVQIEVKRDEVTLCAWFDVEQQAWGFDLLQGGHKSSNRFDEFEDLFGTYLSIHTVFIPNAKIVTDAFERELGINTVYDSFSGNKQKGYTAKFKVLGTGDLSVLVHRVPEGYLARLVSPDGDTGKYKIRSEFKYELNDNGKAVLIPTMSLVVKELKARYSEDSTKQIQRISDDTFCFSIDGLVITASISFNYTQVRYHVSEVGPYDADLLVTPEDPYDLSALYMSCKDFYDDCMAGESEDAGTDYKGEIDHADEDSLHQEEQDAVASPNAPFDDDFGDEIDDSSDGEAEEQDEEEEESYGDSEDDSKDGQDEGQDEEPVTPYGVAVEREPQAVTDVQTRRPPLSPLLDPEYEKDVAKAEKAAAVKAGVESAFKETQDDKSEGDGTMSVESIKLIKESDEDVGVQFIVDGTPYIFSIGQVKLAGLPVKRIKDSVQIVYKCGMRMTEDELRMKKYADELENPIEVLNQIIEAVFA